MKKKQAHEIFEKYNPASGVVRCPNGRAKMRKPLDLYAKAAVNLYGIIKIDEFVEIFNTFNDEKTNADEVYIILLPNVRKYGWYGFYKDYLVHYVVLQNFNWVQYLEREQEDKPRYIPPKEQYILFEFEDYEDNNLWRDLLMFMLDPFGYKDDFIDGYNEIKSSMISNMNINEVSTIMENYGFEFKTDEQAEKFYELLFNAYNNTRIWENKGYTPLEMLKVSNLNTSNKITVQKYKKIGANEPCPCGSGNKYKRCCYLIEKNSTAKLSNYECKLFYETWLKLLDFVNQKLNVVSYKFDVTYPSNPDEVMLYKIREKLWENPQIISELIKNNSTLSHEEVRLLRSWEKKFIKGKLVVIKYEMDHAILMQVVQDETSKLYAVKGITNSIGDVLRTKLPAMVETVLLPFGDKIIYDSFISLFPIDFKEGLSDMFQEEFKQLQDKYGVTTKI